MQTFKEASHLADDVHLDHNGEIEAFEVIVNFVFILFNIALLVMALYLALVYPSAYVNSATCMGNIIRVLLFLHAIIFAIQLVAMSIRIMLIFTGRILDCKVTLQKQHSFVSSVIKHYERMRTVCGCLEGTVDLGIAIVILVLLVLGNCNTVSVPFVKVAIAYLVVYGVSFAFNVLARTASFFISCVWTIRASQN